MHAARIAAISAVKMEGRGLCRIVSLSVVTLYDTPFDFQTTGDRNIALLLAGVTSATLPEVTQK